MYIKISTKNREPAPSGVRGGKEGGEFMKIENRREILEK